MSNAADRGVGSSAFSLAVKASDFSYGGWRQRYSTGFEENDDAAASSVAIAVGGQLGERRPPADGSGNDSSTICNMEGD